MASLRFADQNESTPDPYANQYFFYNYDMRGSTTAIIQPDGTLIKGYSYDEFGALEQSGATDFMNEVTFTGSVTDTSSGLQYMNARLYSPSTGRFLSQDTYTGNASQPWTQNLYSYCGNNPVNMVDPTGHSAEDLFGDLNKKATSLFEKYSKYKSKANSESELAAENRDRGNNLLAFSHQALSDYFNVKSNILNFQYECVQAKISKLQEIEKIASDSTEKQQNVIFDEIEKAGISSIKIIKSSDGDAFAVPINQGKAYLLVLNKAAAVNMYHNMDSGINRLGVATGTTTAIAAVSAIFCPPVGGVIGAIAGIEAICFSGYSQDKADMMYHNQSERGGAAFYYSPPYESPSGNKAPGWTWYIE